MMVKLASVVVTCLALPAVAQPAALPSELARAAADYDQAQLHGDRSAFERLLAQDYTLVNSRAQVETRAQFIKESTDPGFHLNPFVITDKVERVWADGAVLAGATWLEGTDGGQAFKVHLRFADVWAKRAGKWQVVFTEVTKVP